MGKRGPIPFPTAVKERRGTLEKSREIDNQAKIAPSVPKRPDWLSESAGAMYDDLSVTLCAAGLLTAADGSALARLCSYRSVLHELLPLLGPDTVTQHAAHGDAPSGNLKAVLALEEKVRNLEDRFGLNPAARSRIAVPKADDSATPNEASDFA
jgi:P27 family predicted phage terminase small subunit